MRDPNCIFCKIVAAQVPASVIFEDETVLCFLDINPLSEGHLVLIPRGHYGRLGEVPADECSRLMVQVPHLARAIQKVNGVTGLNVLLNDGSIAGQVVPHVHFHLIPRRPADGLGFRWPAGKYAAGRAEELARAYQEAFAERT